MRALNFLLFFAVFMLSLNTIASAEDYKLGDLEIVDPWGHAPLKGTDVAEGFLKIVNHGATADRLVAVTVDFAKTAQIHEMKMNGTTMQMAELKDGLEIPAGATVELKPQSTHLMFMGLSRRPAANEKVPGELTFEKAGKLKVEFVIEPAGASMPMNMDNMNMNAN
ncbi:MAG TPA: copper chaperone PCu(A)C [Dongiaceae bacterium]|nr:copper chaperone PCu(A)C [Dongiaceae bacterium]